MDLGRVAVGFALAAGCSSDDSEPAEPLGPCEPSDHDPWACDVPSPCPDAVLEHEVFEDRSAAVCVAEALRDRRPSRLQLDRVVTGDGSSYETIFVLDDVHAVSNTTLVFVFTGQVVTDRQLLQPPEYFDRCVAAPTDRELYDCLAGWSMGCGEEPVACP